MKSSIICILLLFPTLYFAQCVEGDCNNGKGTYKYKNGTYIGDFVDGDLMGQGDFINRRGYNYSGSWKDYEKNGYGEEAFRKGFSYKGNFSNNKRDGKGYATFNDTRFMKSISYKGDWEGGTVCGEGVLSYSREVKYGREKIIEINTLEGDFINGVYQGELTSPYPDQLSWQPFILKADDFNYYNKLNDKQLKKLKNLAVLEGSIVVSCECRSGILLVDAKAIFRKDKSWWSPSIPTKTKSTILNNIQRDFDIIEWYARELKWELNKQNLSCNTESVEKVWETLSVINKECRETRRRYLSETAWNPKKGRMKNTQPQEKWNNRISKKLKKYKKVNQKLVQKIEKKLSKTDPLGCLSEELVSSIIPTKPTEELFVENDSRQKSERTEREQERKLQKEEKERKLQLEKEAERKKIEEKEKKELDKQKKKEQRKIKRENRSFVPTFPRSKQLE